MAETGEVSIALARDLDPDLILMDVNLPGMDGLEAMGDRPSPPTLAFGRAPLTEGGMVAVGRLRDVDPIQNVELPNGLTVGELRRQLRKAGAVFAFVHGSRASGRHDPDADIDIAAWFGRPAGSWEIDLPPNVDLLVLDTAGLELSGRVAQHGVLLLDDHPPARVAWQADRCKRYLDEAHRRADLVATVLRRG